MTDAYIERTANAKEGMSMKIYQYKAFRCQKCDLKFMANRNEYRILSDPYNGSLYESVCPCCGQIVQSHTNDFVKGVIFE